MSGVFLAGEFANIGDHLLAVGTGWADKSLKLGLLAIVVATVVKKFSMKAGIGALIGLIIAYGIYNGRTNISNAVTDEVTNIKGAPMVHAPLTPGPYPATPHMLAGGERA
ncbi:hypothetical protein AQI95_41935 [Streptomyces yokosukanensis]|uniref:Uncharacterized protein n=1 Tax=Streptomyces yokosukanensis TaxID=67386 RepID=A0A101NQL6_9ACTN|nr:hypothetical protein [Streptomyces yokosukanensis]KUM97381.1 hypothetical protein AQI95_41935 [Streptomyces yokosukanensis]